MSHYKDSMLLFEEHLIPCKDILLNTLNGSLIQLLHILHIIMFRGYSVFIQIMVDIVIPLHVEENVVCGITMRGFYDAYHDIYIMIFMLNTVSFYNFLFMMKSADIEILLQRINVI